MMFVNRQHVRPSKFALNGGSPDSGVRGDPTKATAEIGEALLKIKIDNAVAQIRASMAAPKEVP
jgi:creatinine amidohydrolase/Fe(II)-dependent formamide hydrolase-like protein